MNLKRIRQGNPTFFTEILSFCFVILIHGITMIDSFRGIEKVGIVYGARKSDSYGYENIFDDVDAAALTTITFAKIM